MSQVCSKTDAFHNQMVFCSKCRLGVHYRCFGVRDVEQVDGGACAVRVQCVCSVPAVYSCSLHLQSVCIRPQSTCNLPAA